MALNDVLAVAWLVSMPIAAAAGAILARGGWMNRVQWFAFGLLLPPVVLWLVARRIRGDEATDEVAPRDVPRPVEAPAREDELAHVPEPVEACPDCGFLGIRSPGVQDGVFPGGGELVMQVCPRCDYRGMPVRFERREDYARFLRELARERSGTRTGS